MRRLVSGVVLAMLSCSALAGQASTRQPLDRLIDADYLVRTALTECTVASAVSGLARRYQLPAGIEYPRAACAHLGAERPAGGEMVNLRGLTVGAAIEKLLAMDPRYRLVDSDGVIVLRPVEAWVDPDNALNFKTISFVLEDADLGGALTTILAAILGGSPDAAPRFALATDQGARRFSVKTGPISAGGALEAIVRAHGAALWEVREGHIGRVIFLFTFDGAGIGAGLKGLR